MEPSHVASGSLKKKQLGNKGRDYLPNLVSHDDNDE